MRVRHASVLLTLLLILPSATATTAMMIEEAGEISYQVPRADRIVAGTVTDVQSFYYHTIATIEVDEWLKGPLSAKAITVRTEGGANVRTEDGATFAANETAILMLEDADVGEHKFRMVCGNSGRHPISDRDAILQEISDLPRRSGDSDDEVIRDSPPNPVEFIPPATDHGLDMDGDGIFEYLIVEIDARTSEPGEYYFHGQLYVPLGTHEENGRIGTGFRIIEMAPAAVHLNESVRTVAINFEGGRIRDNELNGPYKVSISVNNETYGFGYTFDCTTDAYDHAQFAQPTLLLSGPVRSKPVAIGLARERAQELGIEVRDVNHTEVLTDRSHEIWALDFVGNGFDERFVIHDEDDIEHWTMNGTMKGIPIKGVPAFTTFASLAAIVGVLIITRMRVQR